MSACHRLGQARVYKSPCPNVVVGEFLFENHLKQTKYMEEGAATFKEHIYTQHVLNHINNKNYTKWHINCERLSRTHGCFSRNKLCDYKMIICAMAVWCNMSFLAVML